MKVFHILALSTALALPVSGMALAEAKPIKAVEVETDVAAIANPKAAEYYGNLANDLQSAILARIQDRVADNGLTVGVDIDEVSLANSFQTAVGAQDSVLKGMVRLHDAEGTNMDAYEIAVSLEMVNSFLPEGAVAITSMTDAPEHYKALVDAFADTVAKRLP